MRGETAVCGVRRVGCGGRDGGGGGGVRRRRDSRSTAKAAFARKLNARGTVNSSRIEHPPRWERARGKATVCGVRRGRGGRVGGGGRRPRRITDPPRRRPSCGS